MQAILRQNSGTIDHTPGSNVAAGAVVVLGDLVAIALRDIAASTLGALATNGVFRTVKVTGAITAGDALYWDADGDPVGGTAGTGALTTNGTLGPFAGYAIAAALSGDTTVDVLLSSYESSAAAVVSEVTAATVAATGSAQGDAAAVTTGFTLVSAADGTKGVKLPAAAAGKMCIVKNNVNAVLKVYPNTSDAINALSANAALSMAALTSAVFVAYDATTWYTTPLLPS